MNLFVGTSGYSYKEWKGSFYPEKLAAKDMLSYYGEKLSSVEINNTFYRMPKESVLEGWAEQVPESFRFSIKASRRITHFKRLNETSEETDYLFRILAALRERLGVVLFQLPPNFKIDLDRLETFLGSLPQDVRAAFEFRHESWFTDETHTLLRDHNRALCIADTDDEDPVELVKTADWGYVRLRRANYSEEELAKWRGRLAAQNWNDAFVFFKHEDDGAGPAMAAQFREVTPAS